MEEQTDGPVLISRRSVLAGGSLLALAVAAGVDLSACTSSKSPYKALSAHQHAVIEEATARLIPGPKDDPSEAGHPGAREAGVVHYIDGLLGALHRDPPLVFAGGPFSDRAGSKHDDMADFLSLHDAETVQWKSKVAGLVAAYRGGVRTLDSLAGGDFLRATKAKQDAALAKNPKVPHLPRGNDGFTDLLFQHAAEGCYSVPEYGGNAHLVGWKEIKFPGDVQPRGFTAEQVSRPDPPDKLQPTAVVAAALKLISSTAPGSPTTPSLVGPGKGGG